MIVQIATNHSWSTRIKTLFIAGVLAVSVITSSLVAFLPKTALATEDSDVPTNLNFNKGSIVQCSSVNSKDIRLRWTAPFYERYQVEVTSPDGRVSTRSTQTSEYQLDNAKNGGYFGTLDGKYTYRVRTEGH